MRDQYDQLDMLVVSFCVRVFIKADHYNFTPSGSISVLFGCVWWQSQCLQCKEMPTFGKLSGKKAYLAIKVIFLKDARHNNYAKKSFKLISTLPSSQIPCKLPYMYILICCSFTVHVVLRIHYKIEKKNMAIFSCLIKMLFLLTMHCFAWLDNALILYFKMTN